MGYFPVSRNITRKIRLDSGSIVAHLVAMIIDWLSRELIKLKHLNNHDHYLVHCLGFLRAALGAKEQQLIATNPLPDRAYRTTVLKFMP